MSDLNAGGDTPTMTAVKVVAVLFAIGIVGWIVAVKVGEAKRAPAPKLYSERLAESCQREFGADGAERVNDCRIRGLAEELARRDAARQRAAVSEARGGN